jgi:hypothetical protein
MEFTPTRKGVDMKIRKPKSLLGRLVYTAAFMEDLDIDYSQSAPLHLEAAAHIKKLERSLQRIANLPTARGHKKPDPHLRARRIAMSALGAKPQAIQQVK